MSGRQYAVEDRDAISERLAASFKCTCVPIVGDDGSTDGWKLTADCPLHRVAAAPEPPVAAMAQRYPHWGPPAAGRAVTVSLAPCGCPVKQSGSDVFTVRLGCAG